MVPRLPTHVLRHEFIHVVNNNAVYDVLTDCPLWLKARKAGVIRDWIVHLGCATKHAFLQQPLRIVVVACGKFTPHRQPEPPLLLVTNCLDLDAA